jgi:hypothetical protein
MPPSFTRDAADRTTYTSASERGHDGASSDERPQPRNGDGTDAEQPTHGAAENRAGTCSGRGALGGFGIFLVGEIPRPGVLREQRRDVGVAKACGSQCVHADFNGCIRRVDTEHGCIFSCHL